jgi:peptidase M1-like protein
MRRLAAWLLALTLLAELGASATAGPAVADPVVRTPDDAVYTVDLSTNRGGRNWTGSESVTFTNTGGQALDEVWFRLWANGPTGCRDPGITVSNVTGGTADDPTVGCTALHLTLDTSIAPGASASVSMDIAITPPAANDRFGWYLHTSRLGNALPILAVNDDEGWHLEPYFSSGESFYSLVSDWTVTLTVPSDLETPTTGALDSVASTGANREARTYVANDVRDFAWEAGPFAHAGATDALGVRVRLWYLSEFLPRKNAHRLARRAAKIMDTFSDAFGAYPYAEVDVVITTFDTFGGMEYPQLVMTIPSTFVISHELAHQWWYGIVGDDEYEDPWIDEGFAQWSTYLPLHGPRNWPPDPFVGCPPFTWPDDQVRISSGVDYFSVHPEDYWVVYYQGACALGHLAKDFGGLDPFLAVLHDYAAAHWLGVSTNADVMSTIETAAASANLGFDPVKFFDRWRISRPGG